MNSALADKSKLIFVVLKYRLHLRMEKMFTNLGIISSLAHKDLEMSATNARQNLALI